MGNVDVPHYPLNRSTLSSKSGLKNIPHQFIEGNRSKKTSFLSQSDVQCENMYNVDVPHHPLNSSTLTPNFPNCPYKPKRFRLLKLAQIA